MTPETPAWQPFHPERGRLPSELQLPASPAGPGKGQVVVLSALNHSDEARWSARAAVRIAREWAAAGSRVFLADLGFDSPELHTVLGEENGEGVTDALLYGASIQHIARPQGEGFFFGPAGTVTAVPDDVLSHPGWGEVIEGFLAAGVTLILYAPRARDDGPFGRADHRVILTGAGSAPGDVEAGGPGRLLAILAPGSAPENGGGFDAPGRVAPSDAADPAASAPGTRSGGGQGPAPSDRESEAGDRSVAEASPEADGSPSAPGDESLEEPPIRRQRKPAPRRRTVRPWLMLVLLILVGGVIAAAYLGFIDVPGITPVPGGPDAAYVLPAAGSPTFIAGSATPVLVSCGPIPDGPATGALSG